ncbi:MAG: hypothetical protein RL662_114 [Bacteroidota bacterium]|jgi:tetratricopeptide (TPR) repeat protein
MLKEEKILIDKLKTVQQFNDVILIYSEFQTKIPEKINYWDDFYSYILDKYKELDVELWGKTIEKYLNTIQRAKSLFPDNSRFLVYEVKMMIELIKIDSLKYSTIFTDEVLMKHINEALIINKNNPFGYIIRGNLFSADFKRNEAERDYKRALELNPNRYDFMFLLNKAINNELNSNVKQAIDDYLLIAKHEQDKSLLSIAYGKLVSLYEKENNKKERAYFKKLLKELGLEL